jgi:hypothetical protein
MYLNLFWCSAIGVCSSYVFWGKLYNLEGLIARYYTMCTCWKLQEEAVDRSLWRTCFGKAVDLSQDRLQSEWMYRWYSYTPCTCMVLYAATIQTLPVFCVCVSWFRLLLDSIAKTSSHKKSCLNWKTKTINMHEHIRCPSKIQAHNFSFRTVENSAGFGLRDRCDAKLQVWEW